MPWGAAIGGALGFVGSMSAADSAADAASKSKDPWSGAEPWIRSNIEQGQQLQNHYTQNPFNAIQQQGMQGLLDNYNHQNNTVIPGLMNFANGLMGTNYQRSLGPGASGRQQAGLLAAPQPQQQPMQQGPFGMPPTQAGSPVNWNQMNPLYKDPAAAPPPPAPLPEGEQFRNAFADAMFPESENVQRYGVNGPSAEELYWRNKLGRPSKYVDIAG